MPIGRATSTLQTWVCASGADGAQSRPSGSDGYKLGREALKTPSRCGAPAFSTGRRSRCFQSHGRVCAREAGQVRANLRHLLRSSSCLPSSVASRSRRAHATSPLQTAQAWMRSPPGMNGPATLCRCVVRFTSAPRDDCRRSSTAAVLLIAQDSSQRPDQEVPLRMLIDRPSNGATSCCRFAAPHLRREGLACFRPWHGQAVLALSRRRPRQQKDDL